MPHARPETHFAANPTTASKRQAPRRRSCCLPPNPVISQPSSRGSVQDAATGPGRRCTPREPSGVLREARVSQDHFLWPTLQRVSCPNQTPACSSEFVKDAIHGTPLEQDSPLASRPSAPCPANAFRRPLQQVSAVASPKPSRAHAAATTPSQSQAGIREAATKGAPNDLSPSLTIPNAELQAATR